jgi:hypothetical protein
MSYEINDRTLIEEMCNDIRNTAISELDKLKEKLNKQGKELPDDFAFPLDEDIVGPDGALKKLLSEQENVISYSKAGKLDDLWRSLLNKSIVCLRYFDTREPFLNNPNKAIVAYGINKLEEYHLRYTEFESLMYGSSAYYRDHVFHAIRVWLLGVFCLLKKINAEEMFITKLGLDGGAKLPSKIDFFEYISMWTITALCHDLGYPLEKAEQILDKTRKMMREFVPSPNVWNNFGYSGTQDSINEYVLKFISTKMKEKLPVENIDEHDNQAGASNERKYLGRIQPKYFLKYAKSLEGFKHGIISTIIIYKMLLYFLESDFNLNDDYIYDNEDARQFYIRREVLRAIAAHTCSDTYNIHITTFSSLLFLCDEFQEWGRRTWDELYTGLKEDSISLKIEKFSCEEIDIREKISLESVEDMEIIVQNISRVFERQYSLYKTTFRDGQDTAKRDFSLTKRMQFILSKNGAQTREIIIEYGLPKSDASYFNIDLSHVGTIDTYKKMIEKSISRQMYHKDIKITPS